MIFSAFNSGKDVWKNNGTIGDKSLSETKGGSLFIICSAGSLVDGIVCYFFLINAV